MSQDVRGSDRGYGSDAYRLQREPDALALLFIGQAKEPVPFVVRIEPGAKSLHRVDVSPKGLGAAAVLRELAIRRRLPRPGRAGTPGRRDLRCHSVQ